MSAGVTLVCLKGTVLVLKGVSVGDASAESSPFAKSAFPCDTVFWMGEGDV